MLKRSIMLFSKFFSFFLIFTLLTIDAEAQIQLEIKQQNILETVNPAAFPLLKASLKASVNGQSHIILPNELLIVGLLTEAGIFFLSISHRLII